MKITAWDRGKFTNVPKHSKEGGLMIRFLDMKATSSVRSVSINEITAESQRSHRKERYLGPVQSDETKPMGPNILRKKTIK